MQGAPHYDDAVGEVRRFLADRIFACELAGIPKSRIVADPGFGFGKTLEHNLALLAGLDAFADLGVPLLAGMSRKRMIGELTGRGINDRAVGSVAAHLIAAQRGAMLLRVHDVAPMRDALAVWEAVRERTVAAPKVAKPSVPRWPDDE
jgi:dihydropteroate synthase